MKRLHLAIDDDYLQREKETFKRFLKFPRLKITVMSDLPFTVSNVNLLMSRNEKKGLLFRLSGNVPRDAQILVFNTSHYDKAKELSKSAHYRKVYVVNNGTLEWEETDEGFQVTWMNTINEYIRQLLGVPQPKERKPRENKKRNEEIEPQDPDFEPPPF